MGQAESSGPEPLGEEPASPPPCALVIVGPSGVGKGTLITKLMQENPGYGFSCSHTTRAPRPGEIDGEHYHFTTHERMEADIAGGEFLEHAHVHSNIYGTSAQAVRDVAAAGLCCILDIDVQGARQVRATGLPAIFVFIAPPSLEQLEERLRGRATDTEESIKTRLANAQEELESQKEPGLYDYIIVNDDLDRAYEALRAVGTQALAGELPDIPGAASVVTVEQEAGDVSQAPPEVIMVVRAGSALGSEACAALSARGARVVAVDDDARSLERLQSAMLAAGTPAREFLPIVADLRREGEVQALAPIVAERWPGATAGALVLCPTDNEETGLTMAADAASARRCLEDGLQAPASAAQRFAEAVLAGEGHGKLMLIRRRPTPGAQGSWPQVSATGLEERCRALAGPRLTVGVITVGASMATTLPVDTLLHALTVPPGVSVWEAQLSDDERL